LGMAAEMVPTEELSRPRLFAACLPTPPIFIIGRETALNLIIIPFLREQVPATRVRFFPHFSRL
jgi:hypothetical protein